MPTPWMPTPRRARFIIVNICAMPALGSPTSSPTASSKWSTHVAEPRIPILCSIDPHVTPFRPPPSGRSFGTTKSEIPAVPGGASGSRASTRCTICSVRSCSPPVMNTFVPVMRWVPSAAGSARVRRRPRSVPAWGSVRHIVPLHSPLARRGT